MMATKTKEESVPVAGTLVNNATRRSDEQPLSGHFTRVISGEHEGRYGVYLDTAAVDKDGFPLQIILQTRDDQGENLTVDLADCRPALAGAR